MPQQAVLWQWMQTCRFRHRMVTAREGAVLRTACTAYVDRRVLETDGVIGEHADAGFGDDRAKSATDVRGLRLRPSDPDRTRALTV